jgi:hypothetical protein
MRKKQSKENPTSRVKTGNTAVSPAWQRLAKALGELVAEHIRASSNRHRDGGTRSSKKLHVS